MSLCVHRTVWASPAAVLVVLISGCQASRQEYAPVRLAPMPRAFVEDIPAPVGFRFVEEVSEDRSTGTTRLYLRHVYVGAANKYDVRSFYNEQMPRYRWVKVSDGNVKGVYSMRFEKGNEACTINVQDRAGMKKGARIQVIVSQEQRGAVPPTVRNVQ